MQARRDKLRRHAALATTVAALVLSATACAGSTTSDAAKAPHTPAKSAAPSAPATSSAQPATTQGDPASCARIRDVFVHLAGVSAGWDPRTNPFDVHTAAAFGPLIQQLRTDSGSATSGRLHAAVEQNADALSHLAAAMRTHEQARVTAALADSRRAYAALPGCARRDGQAAAASSTTTGGPDAGATTRATGQPVRNLGAAAKDPGCIKAKAAYAKLGPVTSSWDISSDPFDDKVARAFRDTADALDGAADDAKLSGVADRARANAAAFRLLADAMGSDDAAQVDDSVITMQQTAVTLASTCPLS